MQLGLRFDVMTHPHSGADDAVARALADQVRSQAMSWDFSLLAEHAVDAMLDYEEGIADEYVRDHPDDLEIDVSNLLGHLSQKIRDIKCPYQGTEGVAFREALSKAARAVETQ